jgi:hypothetical protein
MTTSITFVMPNLTRELVVDRIKEGLNRDLWDYGIGRIRIAGC